MHKSPGNKIRILHVVGKMNRAGIETWLMHVLRTIDRERFEMDFLVHTLDTCAYDEEIRRLGSRLIPCLNPSNPVIYARDFVRILRRYGPYDIVHSHLHHFSGYIMWLSALAGIPIRIAHSHNDISSKEDSVGFARRAYLTLTERLISRYATAGLAVSRNSADDLFGEHWQSDPRWHLSHLGIDLEPFRSAVDRHAVRREFGFPQDAFIIGHVGRFAMPKNHIFLLDIAAELIRQRANTHVLFIGDGPLRPETERKVEALGIADRVAFAGVRPDVPRLMLGAMDVLLMPSLHEGLPLTLMEAQAAGLPCVFSDVITDEADIVESLVTRLSLEEPPERWAEAVLAAGGNRLSPDAALAEVEKSDFNISVSVRNLTEFYRYYTNRPGR